MEEEKPKAVEVQDRGLFDFLGKKEDNKDEGYHEEVLVTGVEKVHIEEEEEKKEGLLEKLHRTHSSSSSSSSDEEEVDGDKKKKKKKGLKEKIKEKLGGEKEGEQVVVSEGEVVAGGVATGDGDDTTVLVEKVEDTIAVEPATPEEEKKGLLDKIKEKLPGHKKQPAEEATAAPPTAPAVASSPTAEGEKKGLLGKIMEKLPGYHKGDEKEGEK